MPTSSTTTNAKNTALSALEGAAQLKVPHQSRIAIASNRINTPVLVAFAAVFAAMLSIMIWALNKGFEPSDEGWGMLMYAQPKFYTMYSSYYLLENLLPRLLTDQLHNFRLWNIIYRVVTGLVLGLGVSTWARNRIAWDARCTFACIFTALVVNFDGFAIFPRVMTYNGLSGVLVTLAAGFLFAANARTASDSYSKLERFLLVLAGFCCALSILVKVTSALLFAGCAGLIAVGRMKRFAPWALLGLACGIAMYFGFIDSPASWIGHTQLSVHAHLRDDSHSIPYLARHSLRSFYYYGGRGLGMALPMLCAACWFPFSKRTFAVWAVLAAAIEVMTAIKYPDTFFVSGFFALSIIALSLYSVHTWLYGLELKCARTDWFCGLLFLAVIPFCLQFGSMFEFMWGARVYLAPYMVMSLLCVLACIKWRSILSYSYMPAVLGFSTWLFIFGAVIYPYCLPGTIFDQAVKGPTGTPLANTFLDKPTAKTIGAIRALFLQGGFEPGDQILTMNSWPGLIWLMDARTSGEPLLRPPWENVTLLAIDQLSQKKSNRVFLLLWDAQGQGGIAQSAVNEFAKFGMKFPDNWSLLGSVPDFYTGKNRYYVYELDKEHKLGPASNKTPVQIRTYHHYTPGFDSG